MPVAKPDKIGDTGGIGDFNGQAEWRFAANQDGLAYSGISSYNRPVIDRFCRRSVFLLFLPLFFYTAIAFPGLISHNLV
ncbi:MAG: hypothetical protein HPZ91_01805 [Lentisphaeria bacterium]|nr:hypothetical protein [Lentisphaeria bacterium]